MNWAEALSVLGFFWGICFLVGYTQHIEHKEAMKQLDIDYLEAQKNVKE